MIFTAASREKTVRKTYSSFSCGRHGRPAVRPPARAPRPPLLAGSRSCPPALAPARASAWIPPPPSSPPQSPRAVPRLSPPPPRSPSCPGHRCPPGTADRAEGARLLCSGTRPPPAVRKGRSLTSEGAGVGDKGRGPPAGRHLDVVQEPCCLVTQRVFLKVSGGSEAVGVSLLSLTSLPVGPRLSPASSELPVYLGAWCRDRVSVDPWGQSWDLHSTESHKGWAGCPATSGPGGLLGR